MRVSTPVVKQGFFFSPDKKDEEISGTLTISDGGEIELEVTASGSESFSSFDDMNVGRLIGRVEGGYVTLDGCYYRKKNFNLGGGVSKSIIRADYAFVGRPMDEEERFSAIHFRLDGLGDWLGKTVFDVSTGGDFFDYKLALKKPDPIVCELPGGASLKIDYEVIVPFMIRQPKIELSQRPFIQISSSQPELISYFIDILHKVTRFISFMMGCPVAIEGVMIESPEDGGGAAFKRPEFYFRSLNSESRLPKNFREMMVTYPGIESKFGELLAAWLVGWEKLAPPLHLYFTVQDDTHRYADTRFLSMAQALEAFHRRVFTESTVWPKEEYQSKVAAILKSCPAEDRDWLQSKLNFGNEISLASRINQLLIPFADIFGGVESCKTIVRNLVRTRNYHAHYDESGKKKALTGAALVALTYRMRVLFALCMLIELGFGCNEAIKLAGEEALNKLLRNANYLDASEA